MDVKTIFDNYEIVALTNKAMAYANAVRQNIRNAAVVVNDICPEGREKALALTKLEEAAQWATVAIGRGRNEE